MTIRKATISRVFSESFMAMPLVAMHRPHGRSAMSALSQPADRPE